MKALGLVVSDKKILKNSIFGRCDLGMQRTGTIWTII